MHLGHFVLESLIRDGWVGKLIVLEDGWKGGEKMDERINRWMDRGMVEGWIKR